MILIRKAKITDRLGIDKITAEFSDHEYSHSPRYFDEAISTQKIFIALYDNKVIGYLTYHVIWGNTPYVELLRVTKSYQRKQIGSKLLSALEKELRINNYKVLVSSSEKVNKIGNVFHKKLGFKQIGEVKMIYGLEIFYRKELIQNKK